jgi:hypothetical protein
MPMKGPDENLAELAKPGGNAQGEVGTTPVYRFAGTTLSPAPAPITHVSEQLPPWINEWQLHGDQPSAVDGGSGSVPPVRAAGEQSSEQRDRPAATRGQLYLSKLPPGQALVAEPNVSLMADTVSTPAGIERLLTLQCSRAVCDVE